MARRPADYSAQLQADQERRRHRDEQRRRDDERRKKIADRQARAFGTVVLEVAATRLNIDQLAGLILEALERADADRTLMEVWQARGRGFFRLPPASNGHAATADQPAEPTSAEPPGDAAGSPPGDTASAPAPEPRRDAPPRTDDLLDGLATHRSGAHSPAEA